MRCIECNKEIKISQDLGKCATRCRADTMVLADANALIQARVEENDLDLLILNRFGRCGTEGGGMRTVIEKAFVSEIPILIPVRPKFVRKLEEFAAGLPEPLGQDFGSVALWCDSVLKPK